MSTEGLAEFQASYGPLLVAACEWRAMQANPEVLADRVLAILRNRPEPPDLYHAYQAIRRVVFESYQEHASHRSILDSLRGAGREPLPNAPQDSKQEAVLRGTLASLRERERELLQLAYWDELAGSELGKVLRQDTGMVQTRLARARANYSRRAARRGIPVAEDAVGPTLRELKPGTRTRWQ